MLEILVKLCPKHENCYKTMLLNKPYIYIYISKSNKNMPREHMFTFNIISQNVGGAKVIMYSLETLFSPKGKH